MIDIVNEDENYVLLDLNLYEASLTNAELFKAELQQIFRTYRKRVVLNMAQVEYIDSSFVGALVISLRQLVSEKQDMLLVGLRKDISDLFTLIRLDKVFKIYPNFKEAVLG